MTLYLSDFKILVYKHHSRQDVLMKYLILQVISEGLKEESSISSQLQNVIQQFSAEERPATTSQVRSCDIVEIFEWVKFCNKKISFFPNFLAY